MSGLMGNIFNRRNCFISYCHGDQYEVDNFVAQFSHVFAPVMLNATQNYGTDIINSTTPHSAEELRLWIENAVASRTTKSNLITNPNEMWSYNRVCKQCGVTH